jgi:DNA-binding GntR family transcriptional regulator
MTDGSQRTLTAQVVARLRDLILSGELAPGSRIDQNELAQRFGISLVPIREALARLQSSGLVRMLPHRGVFVEALSIEELIDIYSVREVLEEEAARLACDHLTPVDLAELEALAACMEESAASSDDDTFLEANRNFHFTIYRAANRPHLLQIIEQLWDQSTRYRTVQLHIIPERARLSLFETRAIIAACRRRDRDALGYMVRYKVHQTTVGLLEKMQSEDPARPTQHNGAYA